MRLSRISRGTLSLVTEEEVRRRVTAGGGHRNGGRRWRNVAPDQQTHGALEAESSPLVLEPPS